MHSTSPAAASFDSATAASKARHRCDATAERSPAENSPDVCALGKTSEAEAEATSRADAAVNHADASSARACEARASVADAAIGTADASSAGSCEARASVADAAVGVADASSAGSCEARSCSVADAAVDAAGSCEALLCCFGIYAVAARPVTAETAAVAEAAVVPAEAPGGPGEAARFDRQADVASARPSAARYDSRRVAIEGMACLVEPASRGEGESGASSRGR